MNGRLVQMSNKPLPKKCITHLMAIEEGHSDELRGS